MAHRWGNFPTLVVAALFAGRTKHPAEQQCLLTTVRLGGQQLSSGIDEHRVLMGRREGRRGFVGTDVAHDTRLAPQDGLRRGTCRPLAVGYSAAALGHDRAEGET